jgi:choline dehydrogenase-like flavoprotein
MYLDLTPVPEDGSAPQQPRHIIGMGHSPPKESRYQDCVEFSESETDYFGMPKMTIHFGLSELDRERLAGAAREQLKTAGALGTPGEQRFQPAGSSLHYLGTVRMGEHDDGTSVCDSYSRVWGFQNLFVSGNGVIPTGLSCNPTLTSVALAVRASERVASLFDR